jgi:hypothetical protein
MEQEPFFAGVWAFTFFDQSDSFHCLLPNKIDQRNAE